MLSRAKNVKIKYPSTPVVARGARYHRISKSTRSIPDVFWDLGPRMPCSLASWRVYSCCNIYKALDEERKSVVARAIDSRRAIAGTIKEISFFKLTNHNDSLIVAQCRRSPVRHAPQQFPRQTRMQLQERSADDRVNRLR